MVLGKLPVLGRPANLDYSRARAYCACSGCWWGLFGHFSLAYHFSFLSPSLWEMAQYRLKYCLKGPLSPKQPTNQMYLELCYKTSVNFTSQRKASGMIARKREKFSLKNLYSERNHIPQCLSVYQQRKQL